MSKYRKIPVIIEAFQWTGGPDQIEDPKWICDAIESGDVSFESYDMLIQTLEGTMRAKSGDFIIQGVNGEIYPCKPDIFKKTYGNRVVTELFRDVVQEGWGTAVGI